LPKRLESMTVLLQKDEIRSNHAFSPSRYKVALLLAQFLFPAFFWQKRAIELLT